MEFGGVGCGSLGDMEYCWECWRSVDEGLLRWRCLKAINRIWRGLIVDY